MYRLPFASINPVTLNQFPESEPELKSKRTAPKLACAYRVFMQANGVPCLMPGYSRDEHTITSLSEIPDGAKFKVEKPLETFLRKLGSAGDLELTLHFNERAKPCFVTSNGECIELGDCVDATQLRLVSMPEIAH